MKKMTLLFFLAAGLLLPLAMLSQAPAAPPAVKFGMDGQFTVAKDLKTNLFLTCGGPAIKCIYGKFVLSAGMYPSLRCNYDFDPVIDKTAVTPLLGTGAQISWKHITAGCLFYYNYISNNKLWYAAPAIGYKFK